MATATKIIQKLETEFLPHPTVSPDFTSSNFHIFRLLKDVLQDANSQMMKRSKTRSICGFIHNQKFFTDSNKKLGDQGNKCAEKL
jgi:hypothetical protein